MIKNDFIIYGIVETSDLSQDSSWEVLGWLILLKHKNEFEFVESQLAIGNKLIPPELYNLPEHVRK